MSEFKADEEQRIRDVLRALLGQLASLTEYRYTLVLRHPEDGGKPLILSNDEGVEAIPMA